MHRVAYAGCLFVLVVGCRGTERATTAQADGKIPISARVEDARALFLRARTLNENLQPHEAYQLFQQAVALDSTFALAHYSLAATAPTAKDAAAHQRRALELSGGASTGERLLILAQQARRDGDPAQTRRLADSLVALYPSDERAHWTLANACSAQQQYACSITELRAAISLNPRYSLAYNQLGYAYRSAGQMDSAESAFKQYIALVPNDPNPYDSYAELLMKTGRFDESIAQYRKALSIDEHFTGSFTGIAADEMYAGRYAKSVAESERYFTVARDDRERRSALFNLTMTYVDQGATDQALRAMERSFDVARAIGDTANMSADHVVMGDILLAAGRVDAAQARYGQAHALITASSASADLKADDALAAAYDAARLALARHDVGAAKVAADSFSRGATARHHDARVRQAHELKGLVALASHQWDESLSELALADQQNPAVLQAKSRAYAGRGELAKSRALADEARHMNILPTLPYVVTRAAGVATVTATSGSARGTMR